MIMKVQDSYSKSLGCSYTLPDDFSRSNPLNATWVLCHFITSNCFVIGIVDPGKC